MTRVALVAQYDGLDAGTDGPLMLAALAARGIDAEVVEWGTERSWADFDGVVVRTPWDYLERRGAFVAWARRVEALTRLANPANLLEWNADKGYLRELADAGVPTIPTIWVEPGARLPRWRWEEVVVKPAVSAGARGAARYDGDDRAAAAVHVEAINQRGDTAMVQPYLADVDRVGELGAYLFGGRISHAITKGAVLRPGAPPQADSSLARTQSVARAELTSELVAFANDVLTRMPARLPAPLYARVDALRGGDGRLVLLELEVLEPNLFLQTDAEAAVRFARAVESWILRTPAGAGGPPGAQDGWPNSR